MAKNLRWGGILFAGAITAMAGFVDGVGFVHFGGYFLSFMSGNSTRSSAALMTGDLTGWINAMSLVASFVIGVVIATLLTSSLAALRRPLAMYLSAGLLLVRGCDRYRPAERHSTLIVGRHGGGERVLHAFRRSRFGTDLYDWHAGQARPGPRRRDPWAGDRFQPGGSIGCYGFATRCCGP
ncbi:YoaK family protein [Glutamicibacter halophytocola]